jgi:hypothetical protein
VQKALPAALERAGFVLKTANEVDMLLSDKPDLLNCQKGSCLGQEAALLHVQQLIIPRLERIGGGYAISLALYDAQKRSFSAAVQERCVVAGCTPEGARELIGSAAERLWNELAPKSAPSREHVQSSERPVSPAVGRAKWATLGLGVVGLVIGAALWGVDGHAVPQGDTCAVAGAVGGPPECERVYQTREAGITLISLGSALTISSIALFAVDARGKVAKPAAWGPRWRF